MQVYSPPNTPKNTKTRTDLPTRSSSLGSGTVSSQENQWSRRLRHKPSQIYLPPLHFRAARPVTPPDSPLPPTPPSKPDISTLRLLKPLRLTVPRTEDSPSSDGLSSSSSAGPSRELSSSSRLMTTSCLPPLAISSPRVTRECRTALSPTLSRSERREGRFIFEFPPSIPGTSPMNIPSSSSAGSIRPLPAIPLPHTANPSSPFQSMGHLRSATQVSFSAPSHISMAPSHSPIHNQSSRILDHSHHREQSRSRTLPPIPAPLSESFDDFLSIPSPLPLPPPPYQRDAPRSPTTIFQDERRPTLALPDVIMFSAEPRHSSDFYELSSPLPGSSYAEDDRRRLWTFGVADLPSTPAPLWTPKEQLEKALLVPEFPWTPPRSGGSSGEAENEEGRTTPADPRTPPAEARGRSCSTRASMENMRRVTIKESKNSGSRGNPKQVLRRGRSMSTLQDLRKSKPLFERLHFSSPSIPTLKIPPMWSSRARVESKAEGERERREKSDEGGSR